MRRYDMAMVVIVDTVPIPPRRPKKQFLPWGDLAVGQSFLVDGARGDAARQAASQHKRRHPGWDYTSRREGAGLRVWRTA